MKCGKCIHGKLLHTVWGFCLTCNVDCGTNCWVAEPASAVTLPTSEAKALIQKIHLEKASPPCSLLAPRPHVSKGVIVDASGMICASKTPKRTAVILRHRCLACRSEYDHPSAARTCFRKDQKAGAW